MASARPLPFDPILEARRQWAAHGWEDAANGMAAVTSVFRAQQIYLARIDAVLRPLGLTFARYEVLMLLMFSRAGALPLSKVGARLQVHATSVTNAVDRLAEQGLTCRHGRRTASTLAVTTVGRASSGVLCSRVASRTGVAGYLRCARSATVTIGRTNSPWDVSGRDWRKSRTWASRVVRSGSSITRKFECVATVARRESAVRACPFSNSAV